MSQTFEPRLGILPPPRRHRWHELGTLPRHLTLYGVTALALHLGHRQSVDFDFFGSVRFDPRVLLGSSRLFEGAQILQGGAAALSLTINRGGAAMLSFFGVPSLKRLLPPLGNAGNEVPVASLQGIAGTKVSVVQLRAEPKDYLDIHAPLTRTKLTLSDIIVCSEAVNGPAFNALNALKALGYFKAGALSRLPEQVKADPVDAIKKFDLDTLPPLAEVLA